MANDNTDECGPDSKQSKVVHDNVRSRHAFVLVASAGGQSVGTYTLNYTYQLEQSSSRTPWTTQPPAVSSSPISSPSSAALSPSASPSSLTCGARTGDVGPITYVRGLSGHFRGTTAGSTRHFSYGRCGLDTRLLTQNPQSLVAIDLEENITVGALASSSALELIIDTCRDASDYQPTAFVGISCPTIVGGFSSLQCLAARISPCEHGRPTQGVVLRAPVVAGIRVYYVLLDSQQSGHVTGDRQIPSQATFSWTLSWHLGFSSDSPSSSASPSPSASPSETLSAGATPSPTSSSSSSATTTCSPSTAPSARVNAFRTSSVLILVAGGDSFVNESPDIGTALPLALIELSSTTENQSTPLSIVSLPYLDSTVTNTSVGCALAVGSTKTWLYDQEGLPSISLDGQFVSLPCYSTAIGSKIGRYDARVVAALRADGDLDLSTYSQAVFTGPSVAFAPQAMRCAVSISGPNSGFFVSGGSGFENEVGAGGLFYVSRNSLPKVQQLSGKSVDTQGHKYWGCTELFAPNGYQSADSVVELYGSGAGGCNSEKGKDDSNKFYLCDSANYSAVFNFSGAGAVTESSLVSDRMDWATFTARRMRGFSADAAGNVIRPSSFVHENASSIWIATWHAPSVYNILHFVNSTFEGRWQRLAADTLSLDKVNAVHSISGRFDEARAWVLYAASVVGVWRYDTVTKAVRQLYAARAGEWIRGVVPAPHVSSWRSPSLVATPVPSPSLRAAASITPSPTKQIRQNRFQQKNSILVLRSGEYSWYQREMYLPLFWDEFSVPFAVSYPGQQLLLQSISLPSTYEEAAPGHFPCTLASQRWGSGMPSRSADGKSAVVPCFARVRSSIGDATDPKTIAVLDARGRIDTSTRVLNSYVTLRQDDPNIPALDGSNTFASVTTVDASRFWISGQSTKNGGEAGIRHIFLRNTSASKVAAEDLPSFDTRGLFIHKSRNSTHPVLYTQYLAYMKSSISDKKESAVFNSGIAMIGTAGFVSGLKQNVTNLDSANVLLQGVSVRAFLFENSTSLWVSVDHNASLVQLMRLGSTSDADHPIEAVWSSSHSMKLDNSSQSVYSLAGRNESGTGFALYATTQSRVFRVTFLGQSTQVAVIASAAQNTFFRGVVVPPFDASLFEASPSVSLTFTKSNSATRTQTPSPSSSSTGAPSSTASSTVSISITATATMSDTQTPSNLSSPSVPPSSSMTPASTPGPQRAGLQCREAIGRRVSVSSSFACLVQDYGAVSCWGVEGAALALPTDASCGISSVHASFAFTCALSVDGWAACWGDVQPLLFSGPLRLLTAGTRHVCGVLRDGRGVECQGTMNFTAPSVMNSSTVSSISAGDSHTCLVSAGFVQCWGVGAAAAAPIASNATGAVAVYSGGRHSCSLHIGGFPMCWGANEAGQSSVPAALLTNGQVVSIAAGSNFSCFWLKMEQ